MNKPHKPLRLGELFAGYGGLGLAIQQLFNAQLNWYAEFDSAPSKIMKHHHPTLNNYGDVTTIDWATVPEVDIISGGSPCQDLSLAGKRGGMVEGTRSNLWATMREAVAIIKPTYVIWENVRGALSAKATSVSDLEQRSGLLDDATGHLRALGRVLGDLADLGYDTQWHSLRASDVGAPHHRLRVFVLATLRGAANPAHLRRSQSGCGGFATENTPTTSDLAPAAHTDSQRHYRCVQLSNTPRQPQPAHRSHPAGHNTDIDWGNYQPAIRRWEQLVGRAPNPTSANINGNQRLNPQFCEWMMGLPYQWITGVNGITRRQMIKACGNGVVPQQAYEALRIMMSRELHYGATS